MSVLVNLKRFVQLLITVALFTVFLLKTVNSQPQYSTSFLTTVSPSSIPFNSSIDNKVQWLYKPSDFPSAPSGYITAVYFKAPPIVLPVLINITDLTIKMGETTATTLPPGPWVTSGMQTVHYSQQFTSNYLPGSWVQVTLNTPFYYDGTSNFIVEASQSSYSVGFSVMQASMTGRSLYGNINSALANAQNYLCDFGFDISLGVTDAGLSGFITPSDTICSDDDHPVKVIIENNGPSSLGSVTINWSVNSNTLNPVQWTGNIPVNDTAHVTVGTYSFVSGQTYDIEVYLEDPNNLPDIDPSNDTSSINVRYVYQTPRYSFHDTVIDICEGDTALVTIDLYGTLPWDFTLDDGVNTYQYNGITNSPYTFTVYTTFSKVFSVQSFSDSSMCTYPGNGESLHINVRPLPIVDLGTDQSIRLTSTITLDAGSGFQNYLWSTGETGQTITIDGAVLGAGDHTFSVTVTDNYGCKGDDSVIITVVDDISLLYEEKSNSIIHLSPNPTSGMTEILAKGFNPGEINIKVYSSDGRLVSKKTGYVSSDEEVFTIDVSSLQEGLYLIRVYGLKQRGMTRLMVLR